MSAAVLLICAAALGQSAPDVPDAGSNPPSAIPGVLVSQPLNIIYQPPPQPAAGKTPAPATALLPAAEAAPSQQAGVKTPSPETPPPEDLQRAVAEAAAQQPSNQPPWYSIHGQATFVYQGNFPFHAPYNGPNSALGPVQNQQTATGTLYFDVRPVAGR